MRKLHFILKKRFFFKFVFDRKINCLIEKSISGLEKRKQTWKKTEKTRKKVGKEISTTAHVLTGSCG